MSILHPSRTPVERRKRWGSTNEGERGLCCEPWPDAPNGAEESFFRAAVTWVATRSGWVIAVRHLAQTGISPARPFTWASRMRTISGELKISGEALWPKTVLRIFATWRPDHRTHHSRILERVAPAPLERGGIREHRRQRVCKEAGGVAAKIANLRCGARYHEYQE